MTSARWPAWCMVAVTSRTMVRCLHLGERHIWVWLCATDRLVRPRDPARLPLGVARLLALLTTASSFWKHANSDTTRVKTMDVWAFKVTSWMMGSCWSKRAMVRVWSSYESDSEAIANKLSSDHHAMMTHFMLQWFEIRFHRSLATCRDTAPLYSESS